MSFFALKISDPASAGLVNTIKEGKEVFEIKQLNQLEESLTVGEKVFIQLGGDKVTWDKGLIGLSEIVRAPYDKGYDENNPRNFKIQLKMVLVLKKVMKRDAFKFYPNAYDAAGIGPNTKGEQNQAIKSLTDVQSYTIIRAMADKQKSLDSRIKEIFNDEQCSIIFGDIPFLVEKNMSHADYLNSKKCTLDDYKKASLEERKEYYIDWLTSQDKPNSEGKYTEKTASNYVSSLKNDAAKLIGYDVAEKNIFSFSNAELFNDAWEGMKSCSNYADINKANNNTFSAALKSYLDFLQALKNSDTMSSIKESISIFKNLTSREKGGYNKIYYGAPGCGKSHYVSEMLKKNNVKKDDIIRVTFHPEYMNCDFVGQVIPSVTEKFDAETGKTKEVVTYNFNPGPFTKALHRAVKSRQMVYLIIEEINRGNAAAIFGDLFQLLDRVNDETKEDYSTSEYAICNPYIYDYLVRVGDKEFIVENDESKIAIPSNLTILATMNSSDQNVFTLDTAFKRRWLFEQISNDIEKDGEHKYKGWYVPGTDITWEKFLTKLNSKILDYKIHNQTNEDKRLGKYFVSKNCLSEEIVSVEEVQDAANNFAYKVLEYVWNDVCKIGREEWFDPNKYRTLEDVIEAFVHPKKDESPLMVFNNIDFKA